jgi:hypothetical protein
VGDIKAEAAAGPGRGDGARENALESRPRVSRALDKAPIKSFRVIEDERRPKISDPIPESPDSRQETRRKETT